MSRKWSKETIERKRRLARTMFQRARAIGMTDEEIASYLGVSISTVNAWDNGRPPALTAEDAIRTFNSILASERRSRDRSVARVEARLESPASPTSPALPAPAARGGDDRNIVKRDGDGTLYYRRVINGRRIRRSLRTTDWSKARVRRDELDREYEVAERLRRLEEGRRIPADLRKPFFVEVASKPRKWVAVTGGALLAAVGLAAWLLAWP